MDDNNNNNRVHRIEVFPSSPPPSPPFGSFIAALAIATLIFMCIYGFSPIVSVAIILTLCIASVLLCRFIHGKKLLGTVVPFGSKAMASGRSDCAICLENFQQREKCLVFPICNHVFHLICIKHWLESKPTCPICRHRIPPAMAMIIETIEA